jgi:uncharacterized membrane protein HdeD (DUF308 family)
LIATGVKGYVERTNRLPLALESLAAIVMGILLLVSPQQAAQWLIVMFGLFWLIHGVVWLVSIFRNRKEWGWRFAAGVGSILLGGLLLAQPAWSAYLSSAVMVWIVGAAGCVIGVVMVIKGFAYYHWGRVVLGFLTMGASFLLLLGAPLASLTVPSLLGAAAILVGGYGLLKAARKGPVKG